MEKEKLLVMGDLNLTFIASSWFNPFPNKPWFLCVCSTSLMKTVGKGEIARDEQFLLFPQCFLIIWKTLLFTSDLKLSSANCFSLEESNICRLGMV